jgi:hypothetical protein
LTRASIKLRKILFEEDGLPPSPAMTLGARQGYGIISKRKTAWTKVQTVMTL